MVQGLKFQGIGIFHAHSLAMSDRCDLFVLNILNRRYCDGTCGRNALPINQSSRIHNSAVKYCQTDIRQYELMVGDMNYFVTNSVCNVTSPILTKLMTTYSMFEDIL